MEKADFSDSTIAGMLPLTWDAFFINFPCLTSVQKKSIPIIFEGKNTLVTSPTATGKTEAVCPPLIEKLLNEQIPGSSWSILYICPTRALVNDLFERLVGPINQISSPILLMRRTGQHKTTFQNKNSIIITTPESFDSLLCKGAVWADAIAKKSRKSEVFFPFSHILNNVSAVVLDEIHLLYGTPRGEQVKWNLERLSRLKKSFSSIDKPEPISEGYQIIGLSATISEEEGISHNFFGNNCEIISVENGREIIDISHPGDYRATDERVVKYLSNNSVDQKVIIFCNSRRRVEELLSALKLPLSNINYSVRRHYSTLDKKENERTEELVKNTNKIAVIATSTLEFGIDIGDVDIIILDKPPSDISSFLQRIGRGNRKNSITRLMTCPDSVQDELIFKALLYSARLGYLGYGKASRNFGVAVQQILSYICQKNDGKRSAKQISSFIASCNSEINPDMLLQHLTDIQVLRKEGSFIKIGSELTGICNQGMLHLTMSITSGSEVINEKGKIIATNIGDVNGKFLYLGGKKWEIIKKEGKKIHVRKSKSPGIEAGLPQFSGGTAIDYSGQAEAIRFYLGFSESEWPVIYIGDKSYIFHFGGESFTLLFSLILAISSVNSRYYVNNMYIHTDENYSGIIPLLMNCDTEKIRTFLTDNIDSYQYSLGLSSENRYYRYLPDELKVKEICARIQLEEWVTYSKKIDLIRTEDSNIINNLKIIAKIGQTTISGI